MGQSAEARLVWGVNLADPDGDQDHPSLYDKDGANILEEGESVISTYYDVELDVFAPALGFTKTHPGYDDGGDAYRKWKRELEIAVPVQVYWYGYIDFSCHILGLRRSDNWAYDYGCEKVDLSAIYEPTAEEKAAINTCLDAIKYEGSRTIALYLAASYG